MPAPASGALMYRTAYRDVDLGLRERFFGQDANGTSSARRSPVRLFARTRRGEDSCGEQGGTSNVSRMAAIPSTMRGW